MALNEIGAAATSALDLEMVLTTIVERATQFARADAAVISEYDERSDEFRPRASHNVEQELVGHSEEHPFERRRGSSDTWRTPTRQSRSPT